MLPIPKSVALVWLNIVLSLVLAAIGLGVGFAQDRLAAQEVILFTLLLAAVGFVLLNYVAVVFEARGAVGAGEQTEAESGRIRGLWQSNRIMIVAMAGLMILYLLITAGVPEFRSIKNLIAFLVLELILLFAFKVSGYFADGRSAFIGLTVLFALIVISTFSIEGFLSASNIRAILLFAAFLGIASVGQTMVALLGGLDLSIPFVIGSSNIAMLFLVTVGVPSYVAFGFILVLGGIVGLLNGIMSFRLQGQALILTLGTGFAVAGFTQIMTSIGSQYAGNVFGTVPHWLANLAAMNGRFFGLPFPPTIIIWIVIAIVIIVGLKTTAWGRNLYALGGNRRAAALTGISEFKYWVACYVLSGVFAALTGCLLLGWSGGAFIGVGDPYLFTTLAAVVIGGTSLLGGNGGYGFTVIGVLVLQVLTSFLLGIGLQYEWQQFIFGLLILPMVALYGRSPHIRSTV
ncbi:MAG: inner-membrane translocator [Kaistia sp. SCN 65-12]|nr:MAG: inner-membrane translocator [Kaistia sp. SCN 65-12]